MSRGVGISSRVVVSVSTVSIFVVVVPPGAILTKDITHSWTFVVIDVVAVIAVIAVVVVVVGVGITHD